ncbi:hypothetical protein ACLB1G_04945 [Oxalobacteraceae bacterium A2-2]
MPVEIDLILRFMPIVIGAIGLAPALFNLWLGRKGQSRDEYQYARDFLKDLADQPDMHPYVRQIGYQALANHRDVEPDEVAYILTFTSPVRALRNFLLGRPYLKLVKEGDSRRLVFRPRYSKLWQRRWRKGVYFAAYFISTVGAFSAWLFAPVTGVRGGRLALDLVSCLAVFGPCSWLSLSAAVKICRAEILMKSQEQIPL